MNNKDIEARNIIDQSKKQNKGVDNVDSIIDKLRVYKTFTDDEMASILHSLYNYIEEDKRDYFIIKVNKTDWISENSKKLFKDYIKHKDTNDITTKEEEDSSLIDILNAFKNEYSSYRVVIKKTTIIGSTFSDKDRLEFFKQVYAELDEEQRKELLNLIINDEDINASIKELVTNYVLEKEEENKPKQVDLSKKKYQEFLKKLGDEETEECEYQFDENLKEKYIIIDNDSRLKALIAVYKKLDEQQQPVFLSHVWYSNDIDQDTKIRFVHAVKKDMIVNSSDSLLEIVLHTNKDLQMSDNFDADCKTVLYAIAKNDIVEITHSGIKDYYVPLNNEKKVTALEGIYNSLEGIQKAMFAEIVKSYPLLNMLKLSFVSENAAGGATSTTKSDKKEDVDDSTPENIVVTDLTEMDEDSDKQDAANKNKAPNNVATTTPNTKSEDTKKPKGLKVERKRESNSFIKKHKKLLIGIGIAILAVGILYAIPVTRMMIHSSLWLLLSKLGLAPNFLGTLHAENLHIAEVFFSKYSFISSGLYTLGGEVGKQALYTAAQAEATGILAALCAVVPIASGLILDIKNKRRKETVNVSRTISFEEKKDKSSVEGLDAGREAELLNRIEELKKQLTSSQNNEKVLADKLSALTKALSDKGLISEDMITVEPDEELKRRFS